MILKETTCIICPVGCQLKIEKIDDEIKVSGNLCPRGAEYGKTEATNPKRIITCSVSNGERIYFVKTTVPVAKELVFEIIKEIKKTPLEKEYTIGSIFLKNILNSKADVVITGFHNIT